MKKIIILILLISSFAYSQVDTANWSFLPNQTNGKFTALISRELYYGISGGQYKQMSLSATSYDSTVFQLIPNQLDGRYTMIENIATYYGKDSGTVRMNLNDDPLLTASSIGALTMTIADARYLFKDSTNILYRRDTTSLIPTKVFLSNTYAIFGNTNTFVNDQIFNGRVRTDTVLNLFGSLILNDTVTVTGRLNVTEDAFFSRDIITLSTKGQVLGFNSSGTQGVYLNSTADNTLRIRNAGVSTDALVQIGRLITSNVTAPVSAGATGTAGEWRLGSDGYIYICIASNTWQRVLTATF